MKQKAIKSFNQNNRINDMDDDLNGIEMKEREANDSSTNLTNLKPVEFESSQTDNK